MALKLHAKPEEVVMKLFLATTALAGTVAGAVALTHVLDHRSSDPLSERAASERAVQHGLGLGATAPAPVERPTVATPPADTKEPTQAAERLPEFDLLRVERDGSVLVAGRARPDTDVEIVSGERVIGTARTGRTGDFVYLHEGEGGPLALRLREGARISEQVAVVEPTPDENEPLVLITSANDATKVVQVPAPAAPESVPDVRVEAVEVVDEKLVVAGFAKPRSTVRVYVDDTLLGEAETGRDERFVLEGDRAIASGRHSVRVDMLEPASGDVASRAEVPLIHEPERTGPTAPAPKTASVLEDDPHALRTGTSIIIRRGDSLWRISRRAYGRGTRFTTIFEANRDQIRDPDRIYAGQVFRLPKNATPPDAG